MSERRSNSAGLTGLRRAKPVGDDNEVAMVCEPVRPVAPDAPGWAAAGRIHAAAVAVPTASPAAMPRLRRREEVGTGAGAGPAGKFGSIFDTWHRLANAAAASPKMSSQRANCPRFAAVTRRVRGAALLDRDPMGPGIDK